MPRTRTESILWFLIFMLLVFEVLTQLSATAFVAWVGMATDVTCIVLIGIVSYDQIPALYVAMPTFLGRRDDKVVKEGPIFVLPGFEAYKLQDVLPTVSDITIQDVRCQLLHQAKPGAKRVRMSGGAASVQVTIIWAPDTTTFDPDGRPRLRRFFDNGGRAEVKQMIEAMVEGAVRQNASAVTFEELSFGKERLSAELISIMTGVTLDPKASDEEVKEFLKTALMNGVADIRDLGVKIRRIIIAVVDPEGYVYESSGDQQTRILGATVSLFQKDSATALPVYRYRL